MIPGRLDLSFNPTDLNYEDYKIYLQQLRKSVTDKKQKLREKLFNKQPPIATVDPTLAKHYRVA